MMMKKTSKLTLCLVAILVALLGTTITAYASNSYKGTITTSTEWKTLATSTSGFNCNVEVSNHSTGTDGLGILRADIQMLGRNGQRVWYEEKACPGYGSRVFWCGPDVYTIQIRVAYGNGTASARPTDKDAD